MKLFRVIPAVIVFSLFCSSHLCGKNLSPLDTGKIKEQFNYIIKKSSQYNDYRVIKSSSLYTLRKHVFDSIDGLKSALHSSNMQLANHSARLDSLNKTLASTEKELSIAISMRDKINFMGISMSKAGYNSLMWFLTIGLLTLVSFLFILFKRSNAITVKSKEEITELKEEIQNNRRKAREREEKVVRKLHDEINRYKKRVYQLEKTTQG